MNGIRVKRRVLTLIGALGVLVAAVTCSDKNNTVTNPAPVPVGTPVPGATPTPSSSMAMVNVGQGGMNFVDQQSGTSTTTIHAGSTVQWIWVDSTHSTTSGTCSGGGGCTADGTWDSGIGTGITFTHTFMTPGSFHYFCRVHGSLMQGMVVVQ